MLGVSACIICRLLYGEKPLTAPQPAVFRSAKSRFLAAKSRLFAFPPTGFHVPADHFPPFHRRFSAFPFLFRRFLLSRIFTFHAPFSCSSSVRRLPRRDCCSSPCVGGRARPAAPCAVAAVSPPPPICAFLTYICVLCDDVVVFLLLNHIIYDIFP